MLGRSDKERLLGQRGLVIWLYGLSGSGKSTIADALERRLHAEGVFTQVLDGDNIRVGLNQNLGFSDSDREENIRRVAEVAKLFANAGVVTIASFITPTRALRTLARGVIGGDDFVEVFVRCPFEACAARDVKGLYAKADSGELRQFTGKDSAFEEPVKPDLVVDTENDDVETSTGKVFSEVIARVKPTGGDAPVS